MKISYQRFDRQYRHVAMVALIAICALATCCSVSNAQTTSWTDPNGGLWTDPNNWNSGVPQTDDSAFFNLNESYFVLWNEAIGDRSIQSAHFSRGQVALFNTHKFQRHSLNLTGATGLPALSVTGAATFHGLFVGNTGGGFVNSNGRLTISGSHDRGTVLRNREFFRYDGTTDIFGERAQLINDADAGIGSGSFGGATTATMTVRDKANFHTKGNLYIGRDAAGASTKRGDLNVMSGGQAAVGIIGFNSATRFINFKVDHIPSGEGGNLFVDNTSTISVNGNSAVGIRERGFVELKGGSTWTTTGSLVIGENNSSSSDANGRIDVLSGSQLISGSGRIGGGEGGDGLGHVIVDGQDSEWLTGQIVVSGSGSGLTIRNGGSVTSDSSVFVGSASDIDMHNGRLEFQQMRVDSLSRITGSSGFLAGTVTTLDLTYDINNFGVLNNSAFDTSNVQIVNHGEIIGNGVLSGRVQNVGSLLARPSDTLRFIGGATNEGRIRNNGGRIQLDAGLINNAGAFVEGHGLFITGGITNSGLMDFSSGETLVLGDVNNMAGGRIVSDGSSTLSFRESMIHNGDEFKIGAGSIVQFQNRVSGASEFTGTGLSVFEDILAPGNSAGILSFEGDVELAAGSLLEIELGGLAIGEFDQLLIAGDLEIAGALSVMSIGGFGLNEPHEFLIASIGGNLTGEFDGLSDGDLVGNFGGHDLFIGYSRGDGNDIGLFTAVPEPGSLTLFGLISIATVLRRRRS